MNMLILLHLHPIKKLKKGYQGKKWRENIKYFSLHLQVMFGYQKKKKKYKGKLIFHIWLSYKKYQRKLNIIKTSKNLYIFKLFNHYIDELK